MLRTEPRENDMAVELPGSDEDAAARKAIAQAAAALHERRGDVPPDFVAQLFGRAVPEDVVRYAAADLATLAEREYISKQRAHEGLSGFLRAIRS